MLVLWISVGAAIGYFASRRTGFSALKSVSCGVLLGSLAFALFFIPSESRTGRRLQCPYCADWIASTSRVCQHCHATLVDAGL